jgi:hypothetical protein
MAPSLSVDPVSSAAGAPIIADALGLGNHSSHHHHRYEVFAGPVSMAVGLYGAAMAFLVLGAIAYGHLKIPRAMHIVAVWLCVLATLLAYIYACDPVGKTCKQVAPGTGGPAYPSKAACDKECTVPTPWEKCSFDGIYRGIQIDLNYPKGEWDADFVQYSKYTTANFTFVPSGYKYGGTVLCRNKAEPSKISTDGDFKLSLSNGTVLYGIYHQGGNQAETEGLTWGLSNFNVTVPPESFKSAMPGLNASVYGYTKCASYKKGVCKF